MREGQSAEVNVSRCPLARRAEKASCHCRRHQRAKNLSQHKCGHVTGLNAEKLSVTARQRYGRVGKTC